MLNDSLKVIKKNNDKKPTLWPLLSLDIAKSYSHWFAFVITDKLGVDEMPVNVFNSGGISTLGQRTLHRKC